MSHASTAPYAKPAGDRETNVVGLLEAVAAAQPAAPALHVPGRRSLTYADLASQIRHVRERLAAWNIGGGDIVAGVVPVRPELALACATFPAAATFAPLSPGLPFAAYCELLERLRPKALLVPKGLAHPARDAGLRCGLAALELDSDPHASAGMFSLTLGGERRALERERSARPEWAYLLATSGTTGRPKLVPVSHQRLATNVQHQGGWLRFTCGDVGLHLLPMHHTLGLSSGLMLPLLCGASVVCLPESDVDGFFAALGEFSVTWFPASFTHHRAVLRHALDHRAAPARSTLRCMRVGAGRLEPAEVDAIEQTFQAPLLAAFSMTEAFTITHEPLPPAARKRGSVGLPVLNRVAIAGDDGTLLAAGAVGEIVVRGPLVFDGYFDDPQATAESFAHGWFRTGDLGFFDDDGHLFLRGRSKDLINRGGEKIAPLQVDTVLESHPAILAAATFGIPHPTLGEEAAAAVVRAEGAQIDEPGLCAWLKQRIPAASAPRRIFFVERLPRTDLGKPRRAELARALGLAAHAAGADGSNAEPRAAAHSAFESALIGIWSSVLQGGRVDTGDDFFLLGGDSLRGARLLAQVEAVFRVKLSLETLFGNGATVAGMARAIDAARAAQARADRGAS